MQKTAREITKYSKKETILKIGHLAKAISYAKAIAFVKWSAKIKNVKIKNAKNMRTTILQED